MPAQKLFLYVFVRVIECSVRAERLLCFTLQKLGQFRNPACTRPFECLTAVSLKLTEKIMQTPAAPWIKYFWTGGHPLIKVPKILQEMPILEPVLGGRGGITIPFLPTRAIGRVT